MLWEPDFFTATSSKAGQRKEAKFVRSCVKLCFVKTKQIFWKQLFWNLTSCTHRALKGFHKANDKKMSPELRINWSFSPNELKFEVDWSNKAWNLAFSFFETILSFRTFELKGLIPRPWITTRGEIKSGNIAVLMPSPIEKELKKTLPTCRKTCRPSFVQHEEYNVEVFL